MTGEREEGQPYIPPGVFKEAQNIVKRRKLKGLGKEDLNLTVQAARYAVISPLTNQGTKQGARRADIALEMKEERVRIAKIRVRKITAFDPRVSSDPKQLSVIGDLSAALARSLPREAFLPPP